MTITLKQAKQYISCLKDDEKKVLQNFFNELGFDVQSKLPDILNCYNAIIDENSNLLPDLDEQQKRNDNIVKLHFYIQSGNADLASVLNKICAAEMLDKVSKDYLKINEYRQLNGGASNSASI